MALPPLELFSLERKGRLLPGGFFVFQDGIRTLQSAFACTTYGFIAGRSNEYLSTDRRLPTNECQIRQRLQIRNLQVSFRVRLHRRTGT